MTPAVIIKKLRSDGFRIGKVRKALIVLLLSSSRPYSAKQIIESLRKQSITPNKTSVYRELAFLEGHNIVHPVQLAPNIVHYESAVQTHHHHLICESCNTIFDIVPEKLETAIANLKQYCLSAKDFMINRHALEFYGVCGKCQS